MELVRNPVRAEPDPRVTLGPGVGDLARVWFALEHATWKALLVVPALPGTDAASVASSLLQVAQRASRERPRLVDARDLSPELLRDRLEQLEDALAEDGRAVVVIDSPLTCPPAQALARRCDAALLCVELGETHLETARRTLEACGQDRFLGAVVLKGASR